MNPRPLEAARFRSDSASVPIHVGTVRLASEPGDSVVLSAEGDYQQLLTYGSELTVIASTSDTSVSVPLVTLLTSGVALRFTRSDTTDVRYHLTRNALQGHTRGFRLTMVSSAQPLHVMRPWMPRGLAGQGASSNVSASSSCALSGPTGTCANVTYQIAPYAPGSPFGDFQSNSGTGASSSITITMSQPVSSITITAHDPTYSGNYMTAYDSTSQVIGTVAFAYSGAPGSNIPDTQSLTGAIARVVLVPASNDYVAYDASISVGGQSVIVSCASSGGSSTVTRGSTVTCATQLAVPEPYTIVLHSARGSGFTIQDRAPRALQAGASSTWSGPAVATSDVTVTVSVSSGGSTRNLTNATPARFTVSPRAWGPWALTNHVYSAHVLAGQMTAYPVGGTPLGLFQLGVPLPSDLVIVRASQGPNSSLAYFGVPVKISEYQTAYHPALLPTPAGVMPGTPAYRGWHQWYDDQNGIGSGTCQGPAVAQLNTNVLRHEGHTQHQSSHFGVANTQFVALRPDTTFEALVTPKADSELIKLATRAFVRFFRTGSPYHNAQQNFDNTDTPLVFSQNIACSFDYSPTDS